MASITIRRDVRGELLGAGFSSYAGDEVLHTADLEVARVELARDFEGMPLDPYAKTRTRRRRHARLVYQPWAGTFTSQPSSAYFQSREHNPTDGGFFRRFEGLERHTLENPFLLALIRLDFELLPFPAAVREAPVDVGLHMISYEPRPGVPAVSTPDQLHRDGEPYTFVHLIRREGVEGGETLIAVDDENVIAEITLARPLDTLAIRDSAVLHCVKKMRLALGHERGARSVLLVDFTPASLAHGGG